jgi:hypothetical protein
MSGETQRKSDEFAAASCAGKVSFPSPQQAQQVARRGLKAGKSGRHNRVCYRCDFCGAWHLGGRKTKR